MHADLDRGTGDSFRNCAVFEDLSGNQPFLDDARTFNLVFDKADPFAGGCVCTTFSYLEENPHDVYDWPADSQWGTGFAQDANTCRITPAAGRSSAAMSRS